MRRTAVVLVVGAAVMVPVIGCAGTVVVLAAGSLRSVVADLATELQPLGIELKADFGGSGLLRERIEKGEAADLLLSADVGSPRKLASQGRAVLPAIPFARNRMCVVSRADAKVTPANLLDRMLDAKLRIKTSTPVADPSGDYAWAMFERIDAERAGASDLLKRKAQLSMNLVPAAPASSMSAYAALLAENKVDISITYCSAAGNLVKEAPGLVSFEVPSKWDPRPVYGIAALSPNADASRAALYLLSDRGQALLARNGLLPLLGP